jgi:hypothetical protein
VGAVLDRIHSAAEEKLDEIWCWITDISEKIRWHDFTANDRILITSVKRSTTASFASTVFQRLFFTNSTTQIVTQDRILGTDTSIRCVMDRYTLQAFLWRLNLVSAQWIVELSH